MGNICLANEVLDFCLVSSREGIGKRFFYHASSLPTYFLGVHENKAGQHFEFRLHFQQMKISQFLHLLSLSASILIPIIPANEELDFSWIGTMPMDSLLFGNKDYNSDAFRLKSIWVLPEDSQRTYEIMQDFLMEVNTVEIRSFIYNKKNIQISEADYAKMLHIFRNTSPRKVEGNWTISRIDDVFIVFISKKGDEIVLSWDTPALLWLFADSESARMYKEIVCKYIPVEEVVVSQNN